MPPLRRPQPTMTPTEGTRTVLEALRALTIPCQMRFGSPQQTKARGWWTDNLPEAALEGAVFPLDINAADAKAFQLLPGLKTIYSNIIMFPIGLPLIE